MITQPPSIVGTPLVCVLRAAATIFEARDSLHLTPMGRASRIRGMMKAVRVLGRRGGWLVTSNARRCKVKISEQI